MSVSGVQKSLSDVERKLVKLNKIADKGAEQLKMGDVLKMATKGNAINSTIQKGLKEFKVGFLLSLSLSLAHLI